MGLSYVRTSLGSIGIHPAKEEQVYAHLPQNIVYSIFVSVYAIFSRKPHIANYKMRIMSVP